MKTLFIATLFFAQSVFASGLPKTAQVVLHLDQASVTVQFPKVDFTKATLKPESGLVTFSETGDIKIGNVSYKMDPVGSVVLKDKTKGLDVENIKFVLYRFYSEELKATVENIVISIENGAVSLNKFGVQGQVTEWY